MLELGISVADETFSVRGQTERVEARVAGEAYFIQDFGPVEERQPVCANRSVSRVRVDGVEVMIQQWGRAATI